MATEVTFEPLPASGPAEAAEQDKIVRLGERVTPDLPAEALIEEAPAEPTIVEAEQGEPELSPEFQAGIDAALEQLAEYEAFEAEQIAQDAVYEQLGEHYGLAGDQVRAMFEDMARQQIAAAQQQQFAAEEMRVRQASLHAERQGLLDGEFQRLESEVGQFIPEDAIQAAEELARDNPEMGVLELLRGGAANSAEELRAGNARLDKAIAQINRHVGADEDAIRRAATRAFDPSAAAVDPGAAAADALRVAFTTVEKPVKIGTRVTDRYAELSQVHREFAAPTPPPQPQRVQLRDTGHPRDAHGRFISTERVTDRYRREAAESEQEQNRLAAHKNLMRSKGLLP